MYLKRTVILGLTLAALSTPAAWAAVPEDTTGIDAPGEWRIRMIPEERLSPEEQEARRWTPLLTNNIGAYDYEEATIVKETPGSDLISINLRIAGLNPQLQAKLKEKYAPDADAAPTFHLEETLAFHRDVGTYAIVHTKIFGDKMTLLDEKDIDLETARFQLIPPGSVVEAAFEKAAGLPPPQPIDKEAVPEVEGEP
ncbi:MAG: hypothetical protein ACTTKW_06885 [Schwartzia sp. (in: firmicutes)]